MLWYSSGTGRVYVPAESWESYALYEWNTTQPGSGPPTVWAQYAPGAGGNVYVSPPPDATYSGLVDCACYPIPLVDDTTVEAIPYQWTDAVPYFAAYLALLSAQTGVRSQEADQMLQRYNLFVNRARIAATPEVLPSSFEQIPVLGGLNPPAQQGRPG
jgi:hypothetical protein